MSSDMRDILGIGPSAGPSVPRPRPSKTAIKKPEGMSREVFALLVQDATSSGAAGVPLVPTPEVPEAFKQRNKRVTGWEWREFTNAGRGDGLTLRHWSKNSDKSTTYTFSRFNKKCKILSYTDEEYDKHLTHPSWDRAESALLFDLCRRFDLRWPVVHDRFPAGRTMEQLKERYYDMCRKLLAARSADPADGTDYSEHPLAKFRFDAKHERERKAEFERLYVRDEAEVHEEMRRLEQAKALEVKMKAQKKAQAHKPGGRAAGLAALHANLSANGLGGATELAVHGLPSLAGLMDAPRKHRQADVWLRSKDLSTKRPASEKIHPEFESRMQQLRMPVQPLPTELNINLYAGTPRTRAHAHPLMRMARAWRTCVACTGTTSAARTWCCSSSSRPRSTSSSTSVRRCSAAATRKAVGPRGEAAPPSTISRRPGAAAARSASATTTTTAAARPSARTTDTAPAGLSRDARRREMASAAPGEHEELLACCDLVAGGSPMSVRLRTPVLRRASRDVLTGTERVRVPCASACVGPERWDEEP